MFRDRKGCRLGVQWFWTLFRRPAPLNRLSLLAAAAVALWTAAGAWARRSLVHIGHMEPDVLIRSSAPPCAV
jgi:hypothetical protein